MRRQPGQRGTVEQRGQPAPPINALDLLAGLLDRENPLVLVMERLDRRVEIGLAFEAALGQRDVELPNLVRIARLDEVLALESRQPALAQLGLQNASIDAVISASTRLTASKGKSPV